MGHSEKQGGSLYMGQWIIGADGETIAQRRKLKPTHVERTVFGEGDGSDLAVHDTPLGRVGALCCWEHLQPLSKYAMYAQNEQVHVAAWPSFSLYRGGAYALGPEVNNAASRIYAVEGSCFVLAPCATVSKEMVALLCGDDPTKRSCCSRRRLHRDLRARRPADARAARRRQRRHRLRRPRPRHDLARQGRRRPGRPLCAPRRDPAAARPHAGDRVVLRKRQAPKWRERATTNRRWRAPPRSPICRRRGAPPEGAAMDSAIRATCAARAAGNAAFPTTTSRPIPRSSRATRSASNGW
jgi:hypothetical protein